MLFRRHYDAYIYKSLKRITAWHCLPDNDGAGIIRRHITGNTQFVLIKSTANSMTDASLVNSRLTGTAKTYRSAAMTAVTPTVQNTAVLVPRSARRYLRAQVAIP